MRSLLDLLRRPESLTVGKAAREQPAAPGAGPLMRYVDNGKVRVYAVAMPGPGVVPPGERVVVQYSGRGRDPQAAEATALPGGQLVAARALEENGQLLLALAFAPARRGGYLAIYLRDAQTGEFKPHPAGVKGLPNRLGELTLDVRDQYLVVSTTSQDAWRPRFDDRQPLRLYIDADLALEWKGRLVVLDERNFTLFQGFAMALDAKASKAERDEGSLCGRTPPLT